MANMMIVTFKASVDGFDDFFIESTKIREFVENDECDDNDKIIEYIKREYCVEYVEIMSIDS